MSSVSHLSAPQRMTVEQFMTLPELEIGHRELVEGEVVVCLPTFAHEQAVLNLAAELRSWQRAAPGRGTISLPIATAAGPTSVLGPDLQWWADGRELPGPYTRPHPLGDLVIEVRSPSTWAVDVGRKRRVYEREGVRELWLVDPLSRTVLVFARSSARAGEFDDARDLGPDDALESPLLPGFRLPVADVFIGV